MRTLYYDVFSFGEMCGNIMMPGAKGLRYEHKSGMLIPRYANIGQDCGSAEHGTIRRHQSPGFCPDIIVHVGKIMV
ncbi:MAG: hypothetical protein BHW30_01860 [Firmicutes bacterium CAG_194_44_15]|nr:MAG: hypothetical protein BHW30_01860 [Firmicutes bacterium CAG_194_44_15]